MPPPTGQTPASNPGSKGPPLPRVLVTAGPTHEPIDAVRFIGNRSSGRMGTAIAAESCRRGWTTTLLLGPVSIAAPGGPQVERFQTGDQLQALLEHHWPMHDILVMAAAVSDFIPATCHAGKWSRREGPISLDLQPAPDLVAAAAAASRPDQTVVGFALEDPGDLPERAAMKLRDKGLDAVVANPLDTMESQAVDALLLARDGSQVAAPPGLAKPEFACWLLDHVITIHQAH